MTAVSIGQQHPPGSPEWHESRRRRLGGSEISAVLGLSPFESRFSLWHRKMGTAGPAEMKPEMDWGIRLEPVVLDRFFEVDGRHRQDGGGSYVHPLRPWQVATPDALLVDEHGLWKSLVEVKTSPFGEGWGEAGTDQIPIYYRCQVLWYLDTLGLSSAHVAVLISGYDYREYLVRLDDAAVLDIEAMRTAGEEFIRSLTDNQRPDIDDHDQTYRVIRELHPDIEVDAEHPLDDDMAVAYLDTKAELAAIEKAHKLTRAQVLDALGNANYGTYLDERIVRRQAKEGGLPFLASTRKDPRGPNAATNRKKAS